MRFILVRLKFLVLNFLLVFVVSLIGQTQTIKIPVKNQGSKNPAISSSSATIYIPRRIRIEKAVEKSEAAIKKVLQEYTNKMLVENELTENIKTDVKAEVVEQTNEKGESELNLKVEYQYKVIKTVVENQTDDYPPGAYNLSKSNAAKVIMSVLKRTLENELIDYLTPNTKVTIKITGSTDAMPIKSKLPYLGEYSEFYNEYYFFNGMLDNITITKIDGITTNEQLAFLRTYGVREFMENYLSPLRNTDNSFEHYAVVANKIGSQYRKISVVLLIHDAFREKFQKTQKDIIYEASQIKRSDVDMNIPVNSTKHPNRYALIIGNEDYSSYQTGLNSEVNIDFAVNDALVFKDYLIKTLGVDKKHIKILNNATVGKMSQGISWLNNLAKVDNGKAELIFYFSGHGLPDEKTKEAYLIPVDVSGSDIQEGIKLDWVFEKLTEYPAKRVTVFLDACFSGGAPNQPLIAMKGVKIPPKPSKLTGNIIVFSSSSGNESSAVYREKQHGLFTYFLLKKLQETQGDVIYKELKDFIIKNVTKESILINNKIQTPEVAGSPDIIDMWGEWNLY